MKVFSRSNTGAMKPDLSIIIVSWNVLPLLRNCLISLYAWMTSLTFEVFVVDNASSNGSAEMVRAEFEDVELIANQKNVGFGKANNQALEECQGRYVLFLNPDTVVLEESVEEMVRFLDHHPAVGMVGPEQVDGRNRLLFNWSRVSFRGIAEFMIEGVTSMLSQTHPVILFKRPRPVRWLTGACWLVRRKLVNEIGPFDENLFLYGEEPDFCHRVRKAGWQIYFLRHVRIVHYKGRSIKQVGRVVPRFLQSMTYVIKKRLCYAYAALCERLCGWRTWGG